MVFSGGVYLKPVIVVSNSFHEIRFLEKSNKEIGKVERCLVKIAKAQRVKKAKPQKL